MSDGSKISFDCTSYHNTVWQIGKDLYLCDSWGGHFSFWNSGVKIVFTWPLGRVVEHPVIIKAPKLLYIVLF